MSTSSTWDRLNEFPPALVRCMAREKIKGKRVRALSDEEVAIASDLSVDIVRGVSVQSSWDDIPVGLARKFCEGCRFDPLVSEDRNRAGSYMRSNPQFTYLKEHPHWVKTFLPLVKSLQNATR